MTQTFDANDAARLTLERRQQEHPAQAAQRYVAAIQALLPAHIKGGHDDFKVQLPPELVAHVTSKLGKLGYGGEVLEYRGQATGEVIIRWPEVSPVEHMPEPFRTAWAQRPPQPGYFKYRESRLPTPWPWLTTYSLTELVGILLGGPKPQTDDPAEFHLILVTEYPSGKTEYAALGIGKAHTVTETPPLTSPDSPASSGP